MDGMRRKYLGCCGEPLKRAICKRPLRLGFFLIAGRDIFFSLQSFMILILSLTDVYEPPESSSIRVLSYTYHLCSAVSSLSALIGIYGLAKLKVLLVYQYYIVLISKWILVTIYEISLILIIPRDENAWRISELIKLIIILPLSIFIAKVIWSTYIHLENNEVDLVLHGKEEVDKIDRIDPPLLIHSAQTI